MYKYSPLTCTIFIIAVSAGNYYEENPFNISYFNLDNICTYKLDNSFRKLLDTSSVGLGNYRRVVGGSLAYKNQFPFMASLQQRGYHFCGGAIIHSRWIITAAHCFQDKEEDFIRSGAIIVGSNILHSYTTSHPIISYHPHEYFDPPIYLNDIALVFTTPITFTPHIHPMKLSTIPIPVGTIGTIPGWGDTKYEGDLSEVLKHVDLEVITRNHCKSVIKMELAESLMCAVAIRGEGSCNGDSGGPLVSGGVVVGITSWGVKCASGNPETFTKVEMFKKWVVHTMYRVQNEE